jgi:16S rRNA (guanine527-N7)-methyltransferase
MATPQITRIDGPEAFSRAFSVSRETICRLVTYEALLKRWQKTINLVAPSTLKDVWHRHFADSAQIWALRPESAKSWLDLGSGAGFPGLVLAIMAAEHGGTQHALVESDNRKAAFLREAAREAGVAVDILCTRIETSEIRAKVGEVNCVTARALAPLPRLAQMAAPYFASGTVGFFLKGREVAAELEEAARTWDFKHELKPSVTDPEGRVLLLKALKVKTEG